MAEVLFLALAVSVIWRLLWAMRKPDGLYEFPTLCAMVYAGFLLPQMWTMYTVRAALPDWGLERLLVYALAVFSLIVFVFSRTRLRSVSAPEYDLRFLFRYSLACLMIGGIFLVRLQMLGIDMRNQVWSGLPVVLLFFGKFFFYGFALSTLIALRTGYRPASYAAIASGVFCLIRIAIFFRRSELLEFSIVLVFALYYTNRLRIPGAAVVAGLAIFPLVLASAHDYRYSVMTGNGIDVSKALEIDYVGNFRSRFESGRKTEVENAVMMLAAISKQANHSFGAHYWNAIIRATIPRMLVGSDGKEFLLISVTPPELLAQKVYGYVGLPGVTQTGFVDSFWAFSYAGCLVFCVISAASRNLFDRARRGDLQSQFLFIILCTDALHVFTHSTAFFAFQAFHVLVLTGPVFYVARRKAASPSSSKSSKWSGTAFHSTGIGRPF